MTDSVGINLEHSMLSGNIGDNNSDCQNNITHLRGVVNAINTFTDSESCIRFLEDMTDEKIYMIISGSIGQQIVSRVHSLVQVDSIFIFCGNRIYHETRAKPWMKIKSVFTETQPICSALKQAAQQCEQNAISISIIDCDDGTAKKIETCLDPSFMYTQILKEILITIKFQQIHIDEFLEHCWQVFADNEGELEKINQFARTYHKQRSIWCYTYECFLHPMLNRALRVMDAGVIVKMAFSIRDLHHQIAQLHGGTVR